MPVGEDLAVAPTLGPACRRRCLSSSFTHYRAGETDVFGWFKKPAPKRERTDEEMEFILKGLVVGVLSQNGGLEPHYRPDVTSEEDFEARSAELPLIVVWGEHDTPQGLAFSMSVNKHLVETTVLGFVAREDQWFLPARAQVVDELRTTTFAAMMKAVETTGAPPSAICRSLASS